VVKVHGSDVNVVLARGTARAIAAATLPTADAVVAVSRPLGDEIVRLGVRRDRVRLVANGVDASVFHPRDRIEARRSLGLPGRVPIVLFVGRLEPQKGVFDLLDAFDCVRARLQDAHLVLIGDGVSRDEVRTRASRRSDAVRMLGPRTHREVADWMAACDLLVLPSWAEGTPNVVLEALASGRPVVATAVGGIPDALDPRAGLLVPPRDPRALADALVASLHATWDETVVQACGPRSWRESAAALEQVLVSVTRGAEPPLGRAQARIRGANQSVARPSRRRHPQ
jgi:glycosyltransferase involved in cell wall biosynthesis